MIIFTIVYSFIKILPSGPFLPLYCLCCLELPLASTPHSPTASPQAAPGRSASPLYDPSCVPFLVSITVTSATKMMSQ
jgi:hypothetical protein